MTKKDASLPHLFLYNGANSRLKKIRSRQSLNYLSGLNKNVNIRVQKFAIDLGHIPDRYLDLIELSAYIFCADRFTSRGEKDSVYLKSWCRNFRHVMKVRDFKFWKQDHIQNLLHSLLSFMSGDNHIFEFQPGLKTDKVSLFDAKDYWTPGDKEYEIVMFSGGLDSTTGVLNLLKTTDKNLILASHISRPTTKSIIKNIVNELELDYPGRVKSLQFECNLRGVRAEEESQRTRSFLYSSIGAAIANANEQSKLFYFENGVVSINLPPSEQFINARASRTTHPRVLKEISTLISFIEEKEFQIINPFFSKTKTDTLKLLDNIGKRNFLHKTVSCSRTFDKGVDFLKKTHCGRCSQCIDRRFAVAASGLLEDEGCLPYAYDFVTENICSDKTPPDNCEEMTTLVDYIRLSKKLNEDNIDKFQDSWIEPITDTIDYVEGDSDSEKIEYLYGIFSRHGKQVFIEGLRGFINFYHNEFFSYKTERNSLIQILGKKEYLEEPPRIVSSRIVQILSDNIPIAFKSNEPADETQVQDQVQALLSSQENNLKREFPHVSFALASAVPDFSLSLPCVYVEVKYLRGHTTPSKITAGIAEDCTKYPPEAFILFVIYDPKRKISDDDKFSNDFENKRPCMVRMIR